MILKNILRKKLRINKVRENRKKISFVEEYNAGSNLQKTQEKH